MIERRQHLRLTFEARQSIRVVGQEFGQDLDRDVAMELGVSRSIDLAHPASSQQRENFISAETIAGVQGHRMSGRRQSVHL
jgi:hypothetical protein